MATDGRRQKWYEHARKSWPEYAAARARGAATLTEVGELLGIGRPGRPRGAAGLIHT
jgi:hypothetical protein